MSTPPLPPPPVPIPPPAARRPRHARRTIVAVWITVALVTAGGALIAALLERSDEAAVVPPGPTPTPSPWSPNLPFEIVKVYPNAFLAAHEWAQMHATDDSFSFFGPPAPYIVAIEPGDDADAAWRVTFPNAEPDCFLFVFDFDGRIDQPHAIAKRNLRTWVSESGRLVGKLRSTHQGAAAGWSAYYRWGPSGWGEDRVVVGDDRLYEFGCRADDQRSLEAGERFTASFQPAI